MGRNVWSVGLLVGVLVAAAGCGSKATSSGAGSCQPATTVPCVCQDGTASTQTCAADGASFGICACGLGSQGLGEGNNGLSSNPIVSLGTTPLPCDVQALVKDHCQLCHGSPANYTAPMSLVSWEDLTAPSKVDPSVPVYTRMLVRVMDQLKPMPQPPSPRLTPEQITVLQNWITAGAPAGTTDCGSSVGSTAGTSGGEAGTGVPTAGTGEAGTGSVDPTEECFDFLSHAPGDKNAPYAVPTTPDSYIAFNFAAPWGSDSVQGIRTESVIDSPAVHHWILYSANGVTDGSVANSAGSHPGGQFIVGWAPGSPNLKLPDDVGLQLPANSYQLEIHYNAQSAGLMDRSGVKLCVTRAKRANEAATHPLGQELFATFGAGNVTGTCKPRGPFPIHILSSSPHMHKTGTAMKTIINRAGGGTETLVDANPFDFNTQLSYDTPTTINEGDTLVTTCTFNAAATFGTKTTQEMCYDFVLAYPAGALAGAAGYTGVSGNGNTCIK